MSARYIVLTGPRDDRGRAPFTMFWSNPDGVDNPSPQQVQRCRAQCFRAVPEDHIARGAILVDSVATAKRLAWCQNDAPRTVSRKEGRNP